MATICGTKVEVWYNKDMPKNITARLIGLEISVLGLCMIGLSNAPIFGVNWFAYMIFILGDVIALVKGRNFTQ